MAKRTISITLVCLMFYGCAVGYASEYSAYGVAVGDAEVSSCAPADVSSIAGVVREAKGAESTSVPDCPRVKGGTVSITGGGLITSLVSFIGGLWIR